MSTKTLEEAVEKAIDGGCTMVQLREKNLSSRDFYNTAKALKEFLQTRGVPLIINDRVDTVSYTHLDVYKRQGVGI